MPLLKCPVVDCSWEYASEFDKAQSLEIIKLHVSVNHLVNSPPQIKPPRIDRPTVDTGIDQEEWNMFVARWKQFKVASEISIISAPLQLFHCASETLGNLLLKANPSVTSTDEDTVLKSMEAFAVIRVSKAAQRTALMKLTQDDDEAIRTFVARVQGKAETCGFVALGTCKCGESLSVDYTQEVIKDVVMAGLSSNDIQTSMLEIDGFETKSLNDLVSLIERKERARKTYKPVEVSAVSEYKKRKGNKSVAKSNKQLPAKSSKVPCPDCSGSFCVFNGKNRSPFKNCYDCYKKSAQKVKTTATVEVRSSQNDEFLSQNSSIMSHSALTISSYQEKPKAHPKINFMLKPTFMKQFTSCVGITDTGAQTNLWFVDEFLKAGFKQSSLQRPLVKVCAVNQEAMNIIGSFNATIQGTSPSGEVFSSETKVHVTDSAVGFYLSQSTLIDLAIIDETFPTIGSCPSKSRNEQSSRVSRRNQPKDEGSSPLSIRTLTGGCMDDEGEQQCNCPQRSAVPAKPTTLPFAPTRDNIGKMNQWLLNRYESSTFNTCCHKPLQQMAGPPHKAHLDPSAQPRVCHTPAQIPLHWQQRVKEDLDRDVALGILERVPYGVPTTWCHRMVVTRKHDGTPRRTVDLSPLNKYCKRETFPSETPFRLARRIPSNTWKTCTDAWNGYHSVPLQKSDRHLTTFITPFGRYRYTRTPQGFLSSGDGYNKRFDAILADFSRKERCIDDTIFYDFSLAEHWWRTIEFLSLVGSSGVVLNPEKFQFCKETVDFAGFRISSRNIQPLPKYTDAIRFFPTPQNRTDIKSWFGLVNQVSNYSQLRRSMAPFRHLLSPREKFRWTDELEKSFSRSKQQIVNLIEKGVQIFDLNKTTCLRTDWSCKGIGYFLLQKHCACPHITPECCPGGWKVTLAGSRFLNGSEVNYAAIDGEALAVAWGLEQTRYFTQGCKDLLVVMDHQPLVKVLGDKTLDEVSSSRLFRIKRRTQPWIFKIMYLPGKYNKAADAVSRNPVTAQLNLFSVGDIKEQVLEANICSNFKDVTTLTWDKIASASAGDKTTSELIKAVKEEFRGEYPLCTDYLKYKDSLYLQDGVTMLNDRVVVPEVLRKEVLSNLHSAHQGVSTMLLRAQELMYWPGMTNDIRRVRSQCDDCNKNAPSQPLMPPKEISLPLTPFEHVFADFFCFAGHHYLIVGDKFSGWSEVFSAPDGSSGAGARGLIKSLRHMFSLFGVPTILSSDGGPEFASKLTRDFLTQWGVQHRVSSAYFPQSNGRAEVAVKSAKRLLRSNVDRSGSLNNDRFLRAMLTLRNTPDQDCRISPAQVLFGRPLRDSFLFSSKLDKFSHPVINERWQKAWNLKEDALRTRYVRNTENFPASRLQPPLKIGDHCFLQNCHGNYPKKWHCTGQIMEVLPYDKYVIKVDGSGRLTTRNRRFLKLFTPISTNVGRSLTDMYTGQPIIVDEPVYPDPSTNSVNPDVSDRNERDGQEPGVVEPCEPAEKIVTAAPSDDATKRAPLALRRLQEYNKSGIKLQMKNPSGRRASREAK